MLEENIKNTNLCDLLSKCLFDIEKRYSNYSSRQVAKLINLSNSTYGRIKNKEIRKPTFKVALDIIKAYTQENGLDIQEFISNYYSEMLFDFKRVYQGNINAKFINNEVEKYFEDPRTYKLMVAATTNRGLTVKYVKDQYGKDGLQLLDKLIRSNILNKKDNKYLVCDDLINASQTTVKILLQNLVRDSYDDDAIGKKKNWLTVQYQSVNKKLVEPLLINIVRNATNEIRNIFNNPEFKGNDIMWIGMALDDLNSVCETTFQKEGFLQ